MKLQPNHPLRRLFTGTVQHVFYVDIGMCDPQVTEYLADMLSKLIRMDDFYPFRDAVGRRLEDLAEWLTSAEFDEHVPASTRQRVVHQHIGDFSLFWTGMYPEGLRKLAPAGLGDRMSDYLRQGKRSYSVASELTHPGEQPPAGVLQRLSERFEFCAYGLSLCRKEWETLRQQRGRT